MCDCHITAWMRRARDEGRLPNRAYVTLLEEHVQVVCPSCGQEAEEYVRGGGATDPAELRSSEEWQRATEELEELLALPAAERMGAVERARTRLSEPGPGPAAGRPELRLPAARSAGLARLRHAGGGRG